MSTATNSSNNYYPMAITGFACYLPGAKSSDEYWQLLRNGKTMIGPVPENRFPSIMYDPERKRRGTSYTNLAALIDMEGFCRETIPKLAREYEEHRHQSLLPMAPGHLLPLYVALEAIKSSGLDPWNLVDRRIGLFNGLTGSNDSATFQKNLPCVEYILEELNGIPEVKARGREFKDRIVQRFLDSDAFAHGGILSDPSFRSPATTHQVARLIQETMQLTGMGFCFDSACSSSLLAFELARNYLREGKLSRALVGGTSWFTSLDLVYFSNASSGSAEGAWPFDTRANGLVEGEGTAFAVLRGLEEAKRDGDPILGIVRGIGVASDGRGKSLWAPSVKGQALAIHRALVDAGYDSYDQCDYIEAHATSTQLGDATELEALQQEIAPRISPEKKIPMCSVKGLIGHMLEGAGAASLLKILLLMKHETILPQPDLEKLTDKYDWNQAPVYVPREPIPWPKGGKIRQALVEAFGIGGLDTQVIVEGPEAADSVQTSPQNGSDTAIAIVGVGCVLPGANNFDAFCKRHTNRQPAFVPVPLDRKLLVYTEKDRQEASFQTRYCGGFITDYHYDWGRHRIPPIHIKTADPLQFYALGAMDEAIEQAGYYSHLSRTPHPNLKPLDCPSTAVVAGTRTVTDFMLVQSHTFWVPMLEAKLQQVLEEDGVEVTEAKQLAASFAARIWKEYPLMKDETGSQTISTLGSRVTKVYDLLGGAISMDGGDISSMATLECGIQFLRHRMDLRTVLCVTGNSNMSKNEFDRVLKKGQIPAEGAVAFVLKRLDDAQADGDPIVAVIRSIDCGRLDKDAEPVLNATFDKEAHAVPVAPEGKERQVLYETVVHDSQHYGSLQETIRAKAFAEAGFIQEKKAEEKPDSVTPVFGDLRPASGMASVLAMIHRLDQYSGQENPLGIVTQIDENDMFGSIVMEKTWSGPRPKPVAAQPEAKVDVIREPIAVRPVQKQVPGGKLVFMLPGQGSQYKGMLKRLRDENPEAERCGRELDTVLRSLSFPSLDDLTINEGELLGKDVFRTQLAVLVGDVLLSRVLEERGIKPDMVLGHSYGEYASMVMSGVWSFETAALATQRRCSVIDTSLGNSQGNTEHLSATTMLSTNATFEELDNLFKEIATEFGEGCVYRSNLNAPDQTVVSGTRAALTALSTSLKQIKRVGIILPVPAAYHSPLVSGVCDPLRRALADIPFGLPEISLLSSVSMRFEADPDVLRDNFVEQLVRPVDFIAMIKKAYASGGRCFVEAGTKDILSRLAAKILADKTDVIIHSCDSGPKRVNIDFNTVVEKISEFRSECPRQDYCIRVSNGNSINNPGQDKLGGGRSGYPQWFDEISCSGPSDSRDKNIRYAKRAHSGKNPRIGRLAVC